jgi:predicted DNA-binding transcriptional regulator YafY
MEFRPWVRQWGSAVVVLSPATFREEIAAEVREMARAYGMEVADG